MDFRLAASLELEHLKCILTPGYSYVCIDKFALYTSRFLLEHNIKNQITRIIMREQLGTFKTTALSTQWRSIE